MKSMRVPTATPGRALALEVLGASAAMGLWVGMTYAFDLIFHFHPALVGLAAAWAARRRLGRRGSAVVAAALALVTAAFVAVGAGLIAAGDRPLDPAWLIAVVAAAGFAGGLWMLLREERSSVG